MARRKGFTLIELLVVIAIIAILAAILFPVFTSAKAKAQQAACMANMKQISAALYTYLGDYNDTFPPNRMHDPYMAQNQVLDGTRFNWKTAVYPYVRTKENVWRCRANRNSDSFDETATDPSIPAAIRTSWPKFPIGYMYNGDFFNQFSGNDAPRAMALSDIPKPTRLILICESVMDTPDVHADFAEKRWASYPDYSSGTTIQGCRFVLHVAKTSNFIFADTHAKSIPLKKTFVPQTMWYPGNQSQYDHIAENIADDAR